jgi:RNA polymerase sigma-70 factor (ECF subfamily)
LTSDTVNLRGDMENNISNTIELVKKAQTGDRTAFEDLYRLKLRTILYHINSLIKSSDEAEDIAQEVGILLFKRLADLKAPEAFNSWLQQIITHECYRHMHKNSRGGFHANIDDYTNVVEEENKEFLPSEFSEAEDLKRTILKVLDKLPPQRKRMIVMYYYDDMAYKDIAAALEITTSTVSTSIMKAKKMIKKELEKKTGTLPGRASHLSALTVVGMAIDSEANMLYPQSKIDSIAHSVSNMLDKGVQAAAGSSAQTAAHAGTGTGTGAFSVAGMKIVAVIIGSVIVVSGGAAGVLHQVKNSEAAAIKAEEAATVTMTAANADRKINFIGGECECGHLNPKIAEMSGTAQPDSETTWQITGQEGEIASGTGDEVTAPLEKLLDEKKDGEYKLTFINTAKNGHKVTLNREFVIDTGDLSRKQYQ